MPNIPFGGLYEIEFVAASSNGVSDVTSCKDSQSTAQIQNRDYAPRNTEQLNFWTHSCINSLRELPYMDALRFL
jgi:hypothetical protein